MIQNYLVLAIMVGVAIMVGHTVVAEVTSAEFEEYMNDSEQWCESHNGDLYNSQSIMHGGMHCELENGTVVHMNEVLSNG